MSQIALDAMPTNPRLLYAFQLALFCLGLAGCATSGLKVNKFDPAMNRTFYVTEVSGLEKVRSQVEFLAATRDDVAAVLSSKGYTLVERAAADFIVEPHWLFRSSSGEAMVRYNDPGSKTVIRIWDADLTTTVTDTKTSEVVWKNVSRLEVTSEHAQEKIRQAIAVLALEHFPAAPTAGR